MPFPASLVLIGAGKMGGAMLEGWLKSGLPARSVTSSIRMCPKAWPGCAPRRA